MQAKGQEARREQGETLGGTSYVSACADEAADIKWVRLLASQVEEELEATMARRQRSGEFVVVR